MDKRVARWVLLVILVAAIAVVVLYRDRIDVDAIDRWLANAGAAGPLLFIALYAVATVLFAPGTVMTLAGGALFGPITGTLYNIIGATLGATLAFLIARFIGGDWIENRSEGVLKRLKKGIEDEGWRFVAFTRLVPLFPFNVLNYAFGLTHIPLWQYVIASAICMLPGAAAYTYFGYVGRQALGGEEDLIRNGLIALALFAVVLFIPRVVKRLRARPSEEVETD